MPANKFLYFQKTLVLIRHAHRDTNAGRHLDNRLSAKGKKQANRVAPFFRERFGRKSKPVLISSPKLRCRQTIEGLAAKTGAKIESWDCVDESENAAELRQRVEEFRRRWKKIKAPITVVSSHGDWIPEFVKRTTGAVVDLEKGGWLELVEQDDLTLRLSWMVQELP